MATNHGCPDERVQVEAELYRKLRRPVMNYVRIKFPEYDPEDIFHSAFVKVLQAHRDNTIRDASRVVEFAITTARNEAISEYRHIRESAAPIADRPVRFYENGLLAKQVLDIARCVTDADGFEEFAWYLMGFTEEDISRRRSGKNPVTIRGQRFRVIQGIRRRLNKRKK